MSEEYWAYKLKRLQQAQETARRCGDTIEVRELEAEIQNALAGRDRDRDRRAKGEIA